MATNKIQDGVKLRLTVGSTVKSGDPVIVGNFRGVALTDYAAADGKSTVDTEGVYDLSVKGVDDAGNSAVSEGDKIYYVAADTPVLSKKKSGKFYGTAAAAVGSGLTATIGVKLAQGVSLDDGNPVIVEAGTYEVPASPAPSTTITITTTAAVLATDQVLVSPRVDTAASPISNVLSAVPQASPDAIIVTVDAAPSAGDKFDYVVIRA